ncbi:Enoyl-CoA hydratase/isomerase [Arabidopsis suecica]|uniref:Enoyl-CoA hydratase/isomerase n=1 Tax=Arabidopsis suecica TaxID=45249 RepID=A0A8T1XSD8_ARASU|nr:Enoyl-CoA hydratase/isomerase [Arabidopsis suecica]
MSSPTNFTLQMSSPEREGWNSVVLRQWMIVSITFTVHGEVPTHKVVWKKADFFGDMDNKEFVDIIDEKVFDEGIAKTVKELMRAFNDARNDSSVGVIILTGKALRTQDGYDDPNDVGIFNVHDLQVQIHRLPKQVIAMVGSFDAGYGSYIMSRLVDHKKAREMWFMTKFYTASEAERMRLINTVVPVKITKKLEKETVKWCREILRNSPTAIRVLKAALNAVDDGHAGVQGLGCDATLLFYGTEEAVEGRTAYMHRRPPDFSKFPRRP